MSAISIVTQKLLASPEVVEIVGDRIFPIQAPQNALRPLTIVHIVDNDDTPTLAGAGRYYRSIIQLDHYAEMTPAGAAQVIKLGDASIEALNGVVKAEIAGAVDVDILLGSADFTESNFEAATHRRYTQYSVRWRKAPGEPADEDDVGDPDLISFTFTAAADNGAIGYVGNGHYAGWDVMGTLVDEPIDGYPLQACTRNSTNGSVVAFTGDVSALLAGKSLWVDGVNYGPGVQYAWTAVAGVTIWNRITGGPVFVAGEGYDVEIK